MSKAARFLMASLVVVAITGQSARAEIATPVNFDPNGTGGATTLSVGQFDASPGNALAVNAIANGALRIGTPFQLLYQARIGALRDANNNTLAVPGLTTNGELTIVAQFNEIASGSSSSASFSTNTSQAGSFVRVFFDASRNSNDLTGQGFADGTLIYQGQVQPGGGGSFAIVSGSSVPLDQSPNGNQYPAVNSVVGAGGTLIETLTTFANPNFFLTNIAGFIFNFNTSNIAPFAQVDPSAVMFNGTPAAAGGVGALNGVSGPNFLFQADGTGSFAVPEPSGALLLSLGLVGLVGCRRWSRRRLAA